MKLVGTYYIVFHYFASFYYSSLKYHF